MTTSPLLPIGQLLSPPTILQIVGKCRKTPTDELVFLPEESSKIGQEYRIVYALSVSIIAAT